MANIERTSRYLRDHPREYGENTFHTCMWLSSWGPSPRIRGESAAGYDTCFRRGTIPANTGRIDGQRACGGVNRDHPREYGENRFHIDDSTAEWGPSPRIRGELLLLSKSTRSLGTIPANTGRMVLRYGMCTTSEDHPREYGENEREPLLYFPRRGPSPRIRGELP